MWYRSLAILVVLGAGSQLHAEDIFLRGKEKSVKVPIATESARGITSGKDLYKAEDIEDVYYEDFKPIAIRLGAYKKAKDFDKAAHNAASSADRKKAIDEAIKAYKETFDGMEAKDQKDQNAKKHFLSRIAMLSAREALDGTGDPNAAIDKLKKFANSFANSWQITHVLDALAKLQLGKKDYEGAIDTYKRIAALDVPDDAKHEAEMKVIGIQMQSGKTQDAIKHLETIASKSKDPRFGDQLKVLKAEVLIVNKQIPEGQKLLQEVLHTSVDRMVKARAHNDLGKILFDKSELKAASWEFLWVDVNYNTDKSEHAKALFYLWKIYGDLNQPERAQEAREALLSPQFGGTEYQATARRDLKLQ